MTRYQSSHQCLHGLDNPIALVLGKVPNNAQMPIPIKQMRLSSLNLVWNFTVKLRVMTSEDLLVLLQETHKELYCIVIAAEYEKTLLIVIIN